MAFARAASRHVVLIPVRDNPGQVSRCLDSLSRHVARFPLAEPVQVLIVDGSVKKASEMKLAVARVKERAKVRAGRVEMHYFSPRQVKAHWNSVVAGKLGAGFVWDDGSNYGQARNAALLLASSMGLCGEGRVLSFIDSDMVFERVSGVRSGRMVLEPLDYSWFSAVEGARKKGSWAATADCAGFTDATPNAAVIEGLNQLHAFVLSMASNGLNAVASSAVFDGSVFVFDGMTFRDSLARLPRVVAFCLQGMESWSVALSTSSEIAFNAVFDAPQAAHGGCLTFFGSRGFSKPFPFGPVRNEDTFFARLLNTRSRTSLDRVVTPRLAEHAFFLAQLSSLSRRDCGLFIARDFCSQLFPRASETVRRAAGEERLDDAGVRRERNSLINWVENVQGNSQAVIDRLSRMYFPAEAKPFVDRVVRSLLRFQRQVEQGRCLKAFDGLVEPTSAAARNYDVLVKAWSGLLERAGRVRVSA